MKWFFTLVNFMLIGLVFAGMETGTLTGKITDRNNLQPLAGANIVLEEKSLGTTSDPNGKFSLEGLEPGSYNISIHYLGYKKVLKSNVIINPGSITFLKVELEADILESEAIEVSASFFENPKEAPVSRRSMDFEEIRRSPGANLDIQKAVQALPAVISGSDQTNEIITRGGNPGENLFLMDDIEIPNPNHFAIQGTGGGPINMVNTLMVQKVNFYAGAFSAKYGDKSSSVMDISLREGSREGFNAKMSMAMSGFGLMAEGPFAEGKGSYIFAAQKSYLDLIGSTMGITAVPKYYSIQSKLTYDLTPANTLTFNTLYGSDAIEIIDEGEGGYARGAENVKTDSYQITSGLGLRTIYSPDLYSKTTAYVNQSHWYFDVYRTDDHKTTYESTTTDQEFGLKTDFVYQLPAKQELSWGAGYKYITFNTELFNQADTMFIYDYQGSNPDSITGWRDPVTPKAEFHRDNTSKKADAYLQLSGPLFRKLQYTLGLRYDYSSYNTFQSVSPRAGLTYHLAPNSTLSLAFGRHYQSPFNVEFIFNEKNKQLNNRYADHTILGFEKIFGEDIRFTAEAYYKDYQDLPILRSLTTKDPYDYYESEIINSGSGYAYGIELFLQKKLTENFSTIVSYACSEARQKNMDTGEYYDSDYDYRNVFTFIGGYKIRYYKKPWFQNIKKTWWYKSFNWILPLGDEVEYSVKFRYLGGRPYTPPVYHPEYRRWIVEETQAKNTERYPAYHRLDFRLDKRFFFDSWNFVLYFDVSNLYNQHNIWEYQYNDDGSKEKILQYETMPVGGFIIEF